MPPPETLNTLLKVPDALFVVFPTADKDTVLKFVTLGVLAEIVMVPADAPTDTMPAPERLKLFPTVNVVDAAPRLLPATEPEIVE